MHDIERLIKRRNINYINVDEEAPKVEGKVEVVEELKVEVEEKIEKVPDEQRKIVCIKTGIVYNNVREASEDTGANTSSIIRCCNGNCKTAKGMKWEYYEE